MEIPAEILTAPDPVAAYAAHKRELAARYNVSAGELDELLTPEALERALARRRVFEQLWPDCPPNLYIYACWNRPASLYYRPLPADAQTRDQQADWPAQVPWTYIATPEPLLWTDVQLLRVAGTTAQGEKGGA